MSIYAPVRRAERMQFELYHMQSSLLDEPPVLIPAKRFDELREVTLTASTAPIPPRGASLPQHNIGAGDRTPGRSRQLLTEKGIGQRAIACEERPGSETTHEGATS